MELTLDQALKKGVEAHKAGKIQDAERIYNAILKVQPKHGSSRGYVSRLAVHSPLRIQSWDISL